MRAQARVTACRFCQAQVSDTYICGRCVRVTAAHLADMSGHARELVTVMIKDVDYGKKSGGGRPAEPWARMGERRWDQVEMDRVATPYAKAAATCLRELKVILVAWVLLLHEKLGVALPSDDVGSMAMHLRANLKVLARHEAAGELVAEVATLVKRIIVVIDLPRYASRIPVGPCIECQGQVMAYTFRDEELIGTLACMQCKKEWEPRRWHEVAETMACAVVHRP